MRAHGMVQRRRVQVPGRVARPVPGIRVGSGGDRDGPWSLLEPAERAAFASLAVFTGAFGRGGPVRSRGGPALGAGRLSGT